MDETEVAAPHVADVAEAAFPYRFRREIFAFHKQGLPAASAIVSPEHRLAYVPIPKNACSSLKLFFHELKFGTPWAGKFGGIHGRFGYRAIDFKPFIADRSFFKFIVVRDPLERFVSAYNNRVRMYRELSPHYFQMTQNRPEATLAAFEARALPFNPSVQQMADRLEDYIELNDTIRHHFIPQSAFFFGRSQDFDGVYNIRQLPRLATDLEARIGTKVHFPNVQDSGGVEDPARLSDLSPAQLTKLRGFYAADYNCLASYLQ